MNKNNLTLAYEKLLIQIENNADKFKEENVSVQSVGIGNLYNKKLVVYGRAVNGWNNYVKSEITKYQTEIAANIETENLDWIVDLFNNPDEDWSPYSSAFWRLTKRVCTALFNDTSNEVIQHIAWTNLYKISNAAKGNPTARLMNVQFELALEIFKQEIELLQPQFVLLLTNTKWANPFLENLDLKRIATSATFNYVELIARYKNTNIIVSQHPQGKPEEIQLNEILKSFEMAVESFG